MARPTRSRIISAKKPISARIKKWPIIKLHSPVDNVIPFSGQSLKQVVTGKFVEENDTQEPVQANLEGSGTEEIKPQQDDTFATGYSDGMREAQSQMAEQQDQLAGLLKALENPVGCLNDSVARELLLLAKDIAESVLKKEIKQDPELLSEYVKSAISNLPPANSPPEVRINPEDLKMFGEFCASTLAGTSIQWTEDPTIERGCFEVHRGDSTIHGGIDVMLQRVLGDLDFTRQ